jgi:hypothetical protein
MFCFLRFIFCYDFPLYFVLLGFSCICFSISLYCSFLFVLCVRGFLFYFYSSADLLRVCFAVLYPLSGLFPCPHRVELPTYPLVYGVYLHVIGFISLYFYVFACNKSCLDRPAFWCDA